MISSQLMGHAHTVFPALRELLRPTHDVPHVELRIAVPDLRYEYVELSALQTVCGSSVCIVAVHGLGGDAGSPYMKTLAHAANSAAVDLVRLNLRGADLRGDDFYHAGLVGDVHALLRSPPLQRYESVVLVGFSLGGHIVLRYAAAADVDPRVRMAIAVCAPLDLEQCAIDFDTTIAPIYRHYVLSHLKKMYWRLVRSGRATVPMREAMKVRTIRQWDDLIVAPRFGFANAAQYYSEASVARVLPFLRVPATYIGASADPMVLRTSVEPALRQVADAPRDRRLVGWPYELKVHWFEEAGHVAFPPTVSLGEHGLLGLDQQLVALAGRWSS